MNDEKNKLKEAFELSDLLYSKRKDEIMSGLKEKLSEMTEEYVGNRDFFDSRYAEFVLKERIKRVKELIHYRLNFDLQNIEKAINPIRENIYKKIYKRVSGSIEGEMKNVRVQIKKLFFGKDSFFLSDCLKPMNKTVDEEEYRLLENVKRDIKIHQLASGLKSNEKIPSKVQEKDYEKHEYKCTDQIHVLGTSSISRSNEIIVNKIKIKIGDSLFLLLLRLAVELKKGESGWISIFSLSDDHIITDPNKYQIYSRLRTTLQGSLIDKDGKKFIENDGSKNYRISTHPDFITYNKEKLLSHKDPQIRKLAEELP